MPLAPKLAEEHKTMKQLCISTLQWLGILGCVMIMAASAYPQTTGSPSGAATKAAFQNTPPVINPASTEHPAPAPAPAPPSAQDQPALEFALCGVDVEPKDPKALPQAEGDPKTSPQEA